MEYRTVTVVNGKAFRAVQIFIADTGNLSVVGCRRTAVASMEGRNAEADCVLCGWDVADSGQQHQCLQALQSFDRDLGPGYVLRRWSWRRCNGTEPLSARRIRSGDFAEDTRRLHEDSACV